MYDEKIKIRYLKKIKLAKKYNKHYYDIDKPIISDQEFDLLKKEIIDLENRYSFLKSKNSPTKTIGFKPSKKFEKKSIKFQCYHLEMLLMKKI